MYEERRNTFSIRDIILQLLMVVLFTLIMIWLFPTKSYLKDNFVGKDELQSEISQQLQSIYGRLFADNIESMRDAAKGYFTNPRLPQKIGDSVTLTLGEMIDKKLVLSFKDSNNQTCDVNKSYVKITKMNDEYQMKVQLSCSDYEDYIIVYMGCYSYCDSNICIKDETTTSKPSTPTTSNDDKNPETPVVNKKYEYEYRLDTQNTYSSWGPWSSWSKTLISPNNLRQVEIKTEKETTGYRTETYIDYETVIEYKTQTTQVQTGTRPVANGTYIVDTQPASGGSSTQKVYGNVVTSTTAGGYGSWVYQGYVTFKYSPSNTDTTKYEYVSHKTTVDCSNVCQNVTTYTYKKYTRSYTAGTTTYSCPADYPNQEGSGSGTRCYKYVTTSTGYSCPSGYSLEGTNCVKRETKYTYEPVYENVTTTVPVEVTKAVEKTKQVPIKENVKYYRYRTRKQLTIAGTYYKWSTNKNDQTLLSQGYYLTGNKREV